MKRTVLVPLTLLAVAVALVGCDTTATVPESEVVVEAHLRGGGLMEPVRLTRSVDIDDRYVSAEVAVRNAEVVVHRLADDGGVAETTPFRERDDEPGVYEPIPVPLPRIQPETSYRLEATTQQGTQVTATTTVPALIEIEEVENEQVVYQGTEQPSFTLAPLQTESDEQAVLVLTTTSLLDFTRPEEELRAQLTPLYLDGFDPEDDSISALRVTSSGVLNEANFGRNADGSVTIDLPWLSVAFYGRNEVATHRIDDNFYDLIRSQQVQQGGGLAPGEIPNVMEHVNGGTGIFGSYVRSSRVVTILRPGQ